MHKQHNSSFGIVCFFMPSSFDQDLSSDQDLQEKFFSLQQGKAGGILVKVLKKRFALVYFGWASSG